MVSCSCYIKNKGNAFFSWKVTWNRMFIVIFIISEDSSSSVADLSNNSHKKSPSHLKDIQNGQMLDYPSRRIQPSRSSNMERLHQFFSLDLNIFYSEEMHWAWQWTRQCPLQRGGGGRHTHTHTCTHTLTHAHTHAHTHTLTHSHTHMHTHIHTHTHARTQTHK